MKKIGAISNSDNLLYNYYLLGYNALSFEKSTSYIYIYKRDLVHSFFTRDKMSIRDFR